MEKPEKGQTRVYLFCWGARLAFTGNAREGLSRLAAISRKRDVFSFSVLYKGHLFNAGVLVSRPQGSEQQIQS